MHIHFLLIMLVQLVFKFDDLCLMIDVPPNHLYLAMQNTQTRYSMAIQEQRMQRMVCVDPTVLQIKGLQQFKNHILIINNRNCNIDAQSLEGVHQTNIFISKVFLIIEMKGKIISQQSFKKMDIPQQISIRINRPNHNTPESPALALFYNETPLPDLLKQEIKQVRTRIEKSQKILSQSRRQQKRPQHIVPSDSIPLRFNYESTKAHNNTFDLYQLDERDSEESHQSEGVIQLPIHLQPSIDERNYMTLQKTANKSNKNNLKNQYMSQKQQSSFKNERGLFLNELTNSLEKRNFSKSIESNRTPSNRMKNTSNKSQLKRQKFRENFKQKRLTEDERTKLQQFLITIDQQMSHRSKEKTKREKSTGRTIKKQNPKVKIKLNNPTGVRTKNEHYYTSVRPRYHIQMPQEKANIAHHSFKPKQEGVPKTDWQELRQKLQKYQFVKKYLHESDLHQIYEYLKKNHINQQKWPLFVVDEAYKRMNSKY